MLGGIRFQVCLIPFICTSHLVICENTYTVTKGTTLNADGYEVTESPIRALSYRHCAMLCDFTSECLAGNYDADLNQCRLYRDLNGTMPAQENDYMIMKNEFGVGKYQVY